MDEFSSESTLEVQGFTPYAQIPRWVLRSGSSLSHGAVRLYGVIMTYADNSTRAAFPGREKLAQDMGVKVRSISTYIKELEDYGALRVTRRRNKRTGNFYANHYALVFTEPDAEYCTPPDATDCPRTRSTEIPRSTGSTSDPGGSEQQEKQLHPQPDGRGRAPEERNDPIGPAFADSDDRRTLINDIWAVAKHNSTPGRKGIDHIVKGIDLVDRFDTHLVDMFGTDDLLDHLIWDMNWQPPRACTDRKEAGKWLNTFLRAWATEAGPLTWRAEK